MAKAKNNSDSYTIEIDMVINSILFWQCKLNGKNQIFHRRYANYFLLMHFGQNYAQFLQTLQHNLIDRYDRNEVQFSKFVWWVSNQGDNNSKSNYNSLFCPIQKRLIDYPKNII